MKHLKRFEKYNDNRLNELIVKYYNEYSEEIIEIIDSYEKSSDAQNIMEKISFIVESPGDVEIVEKDGEFYHINYGEATKYSSLNSLINGTLKQAYLRFGSISTHYYLFNSEGKNISPAGGRFPAIRFGSA